MVIDSRVNHDRLLFFDALRILSVAMVVFGHLVFYLNIAPFNVYVGIPNIYYMHIGSIGVTILLIVSGAVMEYNYKGVSSAVELLKFYSKRILRLYPAYWMAFLMAVIVILSGAPDYLSKLPLSDLLVQVAGFYAFTNTDKFGGTLGVGWFIGLIVVLYLAYPLMSRLLKWRPLLVITGLFAISFGLKYYFNTTYPGSTLELWFPLCRVFEFGLGVFLAQKGLYPKATYRSGTIKYLAEISFCVFLTHQFIIFLTKINFPLYVISTIVLSTMIYYADERFQRAGRKLIDRIFSSSAGALRYGPALAKSSHR